MTRFVSWHRILTPTSKVYHLFMVVSGFYDCVSVLLKYRSYQKIFSATAMYESYTNFRN